MRRQQRRRDSHEKAAPPRKGLRRGDPGCYPPRERNETVTNLRGSPRVAHAGVNGGPSHKMAKRNRGSNRPGQRRPDRHGSARPQSQPTPRAGGSLSAAEEARAAEIESQIVAQERASEAGRARTRERTRASETARPGRAGGQGLLAARAAEEYAYVVRDVRRILVVGGTVAAVLAVLYVLIDVAHVVTIS